MLSNSTDKIRKIRMGIDFFITSFSRPAAIAVELSSECNADCIMCARDKMARPARHMDLELFKRIILDAKKTGIKIFQLSFFGESLLHPQFVECVRFLRESIQDAVIMFSTNASLLDLSTAYKILELKVSLIKISIDGNNKKEYESIRRGLEYNVLLENTQGIRRLIDERGLETEVLIYGLNLAPYPLDSDEYIRYWKSYAHKVFTRHENSIRGKGNMLQKVAPCFRPFAYMVVLSSGEVTICDNNWLGVESFTNVMSASIKKIWFHPKYLKYRLFSLFGFKKLIGLCRECPYLVLEGPIAEMGCIHS